MTVYTKHAIDIFNPVDGSGNARGPVMGEVQTWGEEVEVAIGLAENGLRWLFASSTSMADPGAGNIRLNSATLSSVTAVAISATSGETGNPNVTSFIGSWDDSTNLLHRGYVILKKAAAPENFVILEINAALTDNTTWLDLAVAYSAGSGSFSDQDVLSIQFYRSGDAGGYSPGGTDVAIADGGTGASTAAGALVNLGVRRQLTGDTTFYVRTDGSNANDGSANTSGAAWLTIGFAVGWIMSNIDARGHNVTIQVGDGTYTENVTVFGRLPGARVFNDGVDITILGNTSSPGNVIWQCPTGNCLTCIAGSVAVNGFKLKRSGVVSCNGFFSEKGGFIHYYNHIWDDFTAGYPQVITEGGHIYFDGGTLSIQGNFANWILMQGGGEFICQSVVVSMPNALTFTDFVDVLGPGFLQFANTFSGTGSGSGSTGRKYNVKGTAVLALGAATLPGATAGALDSGQVR